MKLLLLGILSALLVMPVFAQNLLRNGNFENGLENWRNTGDPDSAKIAVKDGSNLLVLSGNGRKLGIVSQQLAAFPTGSKLILSGRVGTDRIKENTYTGLGYAMAAAVEKDAAGNTLVKHDLFHERGTSAIHSFKKEFTTRAGTVSLEIELSIFDADGEAFFDDLKLVPAAAGPKNLVRGGSFDEGISWADLGNPAQFRLDPEKPFSGKVSGRVDGSTEKGEGNIAFVIDEVEPGTVYSFETQMRTSALSPRPQEGRGVAIAAIWQLDAKGELIGALDAVMVNEATDWKKYIRNFKTLPETRQLKVILGLFQANGTVWFDEVSLTAVEGAANKIENGDFELEKGGALSSAWGCVGNGKMFAIEPASGRNGGGALRVSGSSADGEGNLQCVVSDFKPDALYDFSVWVSTRDLAKRTPDGKGAGIVAIWQLNAKGELITAVDAVTVIENIPFRKFEKTIRTLPDARKLVIIFGLFQANGSIFFDDAALTESAAAALVKGELAESRTDLSAPYVKKFGDRYILGNNRFEAAVSVAEGRLTSLIPKHVVPPVNLLAAPASLGVKTIVKNVTSDFPPAFESIEVIDSGVKIIRRLPDGGKCVETFAADRDHLRWDAVINAPATAADREVRIDYVLPMVKSFENIFYTSLGKSVPLESLSAGEIRYRYDGGMLIPMITLGNGKFDFGVSAVSPFEYRRPDLSFLLESGDFAMRYKHFRYGKGSEIVTGLALVPHRDDFRPALGWLLERYPDYFSAAPQVREREGLLGLSGPDDYYREVASHWRKHGAAINIYGGHFPFYGLYAPENREEWSVFINGTMSQKDQWPLSRYENEKSALKAAKWPDHWWSSYARNRETIAEFKKQGVANYIYWNPSEVWIPYAEKEFRSDIALDSDGRFTVAIPEHYVLNQDPRGAWGKHIYSELEKMMARYPAVDGIFADRVDYISWDFGRDDGITMLNDRRAYTMAFALDEMLQKAYGLMHSLGKGTYANGPIGIELYRNLDAVLIENPGVHPIPQCFQFFGLRRPIVFSHTTGNQQTIEDRLKHSLAWGVYPVLTHPSPVAPNIDRAGVTESFLPLFELMKGRDWVLNAHALKLPSNAAGNIFKLKDGSYLVTVISSLRSRLGKLEFDRNATVEINPENRPVNEVYAVSVDYPGLFKMPFEKHGDETLVKLPPFGTALALLVNGHGAYRAAALGMPVLKSGENELRFTLFGGENPENVVLKTVSGEMVASRRISAEEVAFPVKVGGDGLFRAELVWKSGKTQSFAWHIDGK